MRDAKSEIGGTQGQIEPARPAGELSGAREDSDRVNTPLPLGAVPFSARPIWTILKAKPQ